MVLCKAGMLMKSALSAVTGLANRPGPTGMVSYSFEDLFFFLS